MRVALLSCNAQAGDAIGNNVAEKLLFFRDRAADVRVFVNSDYCLHPTIRGHHQLVTHAQLSQDDWQFLESSDLICAEFGIYYPLLSILPLLCGGKAKIMLDYHGITPPKLWGRQNREMLIKGLQNRGLAWLADVTLTHSRFTHEEMSQYTRLPPKRIQRLGFPLDARWFAPLPTRDDCRRKLGLEGKQVLLFVGRLAPNKQPVLLVEALAQLSDLSPGVHAVFVGDTSDLYQREVERCHERARQLGVTDRLEIVGFEFGERLRTYFRAADVLVVPSRWESFCIPVIEAMASGLPVVAARCTALPETMASAGLTFLPGDANDLARQIRRVLHSETEQPSAPSRLKIGVVTTRFGMESVSGVETSLRHMALALQEGGCHVEVFTTTAPSEPTTSQRHSAGLEFDSSLSVNRFSPENGEPLYSEALLAELGRRIEEFDYLVTGPYLSSLASAVVRRWPDKTIIVPCFHDEKEARQECWPTLFDRAAGVIYHSEEEKAFAEGVIGINHPGAAVIGTIIDVSSAADPGRGRALVGADRYLFFGGRYHKGKNLQLLFDLARRFDAEHPGCLRFVFTGQGDIAIPREPWAIDLGYLPQADFRDVLAGAVALAHLSCNESLSLVALEAWAQGVPVIAHRRGAVLSGHIRRGGGGLLIDNYDEFAAAVSSLVTLREKVSNPCRSHAETCFSPLRASLGAAGREYVRKNFGQPEAFTQKLQSALRNLQQPLAERLRQQGLERATLFERSKWRHQFGEIVENVLHAPAIAIHEKLIVQSKGEMVRATATDKTVLVPLRLSNQGTLPVVAEGPGRTVVAGCLEDLEGRVVAVLPPCPIASLIMPGRTSQASFPLTIPKELGAYVVRLWTERANARGERSRRGDKTNASRQQSPLSFLGNLAEIKRNSEGKSSAERLIPNGGAELILEEALAALAEAQEMQRLPEDYHDVTLGRFAGIKRWLKNKLLGNFRRAYVDVLSRQQSAYNQRLIIAMQSLMECCATLSHAVQMMQEGPGGRETGKCGEDDDGSARKAQGTALAEASGVGCPESGANRDIWR